MLHVLSSCLFSKNKHAVKHINSFEVNSEVISKYYSPPSSRRARFLNFRPFVQHKITFCFANYSACVVYTKTIIHLSVDESDGYLPRRFAAR